MKAYKAYIKEENGATIVMVAISLVALLGLAALAIDVGNLYYRHTRLQDIADACALAAGTQLGEETGNDSKKKSAAYDKAVAYAINNGLAANSSGGYSANMTYGTDELGTMTVSFPDGIKAAKIDMTVNSDLYLARVLGFNQTPVSVSATARLGGAKNYTGDLVPLAFIDTTYETGTTYDLVLDPGDGFSGNFGFLDFGGNGGGATELKTNIEKGYEGQFEKNDQYYLTDTKPGQATNPVDKAISARIARCVTECPGMGCCIPTNYKANCPRVVIVPMVNDLPAANGSDQVTFIRFARVFLEGYSKVGKTRTLRVVFLETVDPSLVMGDDSDNYIVQTVRLTD